jgi:hypothetical protein
MSSLLDARTSAIATEMNLLGVRIADGDDTQLLEDICREWFLPTHIGHASAIMERIEAGEDLF